MSSLSSSGHLVCPGEFVHNAGCSSRLAERPNGRTASSPTVSAEHQRVPVTLCQAPLELLSHCGSPLPDSTPLLSWLSSLSWCEPPAVPRYGHSCGVLIRAQDTRVFRDTRVFPSLLPWAPAHQSPNRWFLSALKVGLLPLCCKHSEMLQVWSAEVYSAALKRNCDTDCSYNMENP